MTIRPCELTTKVDATAYSSANAGEREGQLSDLRVRERYQTIFELYDRMMRAQNGLPEGGEH